MSFFKSVASTLLSTGADMFEKHSRKMESVSRDSSRPEAVRQKAAQMAGEAKDVADKLRKGKNDDQDE